MNLKTSKKVYVILLNWNGYRDTVKCINSLLKSDYKVEIVLVDNCSTERNIEQISQKYHGVKFIQSLKNAGFGSGNNYGIKYALAHGADYVYVLNNDTIILEDSISILLEFMERNITAVAASPLILYGNEQEIIWYGGGFFSWRKGGPRIIRKNKNKKVLISENPEQVEFMTGCAMFIRASVLKQAGDFDENFFMYVEDVDLSLRLKQFGSIYIVPKSVIYHYVHATATKESKNYFRDLDSPLNPSLCFYIRHSLFGHFYLVRKHNPAIKDKWIFYIYIYLRWLKKSFGYLIYGRTDAFKLIIKIMFRPTKANIVR